MLDMNDTPMARGGMPPLLPFAVKPPTGESTHLRHAPSLLSLVGEVYGNHIQAHMVLVCD
jgi:hypothetical protein